jgi:hypothetical protein
VTASFCTLSSHLLHGIRIGQFYSKLPPNSTRILRNSWYGGFVPCTIWRWRVSRKLNASSHMLYIIRLINNNESPYVALVSEYILILNMYAIHPFFSVK